MSPNNPSSSAIYLEVSNVNDPSETHLLGYNPVEMVTMVLSPTRSMEVMAGQLVVEDVLLYNQTAMKIFKISDSMAKTDHQKTLIQTTPPAPVVSVLETPEVVVEAPAVVQQLQVVGPVEPAAPAPQAAPSPLDAQMEVLQKNLAMLKPISSMIVKMICNDTGLLDMLGTAMNRRNQYLGEFHRRVNMKCVKRGDVTMSEAPSDDANFMLRRNDDGHPTEPGKINYFVKVPVNDHDTAGNHIQKLSWVAIDNLDAIPDSMIAWSEGRKLKPNHSYYALLLNPTEEQLVEIQQEVHEELSNVKTAAQSDGDAGGSATA